ncbi:hypothetical protein TNIN_426861 [Trichonephila inaurata madagascariensis]|uniref:Uncharacterized protein n=1 Tax=Trichonephila inaurata madagascariensis TaxID=2747483 RepID=A0A8X6II69_9ARAC|nr:hypothetical protein TNIN_426861 [Trichonephila inaurata madagascariensis]
MPRENPNFDHNILNADKTKISLAQSEAVYHMCLALNLKVQLAPVETRKAWHYQPKQKSVTSTCKTDLKRTKIIPAVRSYTVYKMCDALGVEVDYNPLIEQPSFVRKRRKNIPVVKSEFIYKLCQDLNIKVKLAPLPEVKY